MLTPRVFETPIAPPRRDFQGVAATGKDTLPAPRSQPYPREQRAMVRASLDRYLHTHNYDREDRDHR
jgi:hypothetical protein